jgi:hypothetical protein
MGPAIEADLELLRAFGAMRPTDVAAPFAARIERLFTSVAERVAKAGANLDDYVAILEFLARHHPKGWLLLASMYEERAAPDWVDDAKDAIRKFLESTPRNQEQGVAWRRLAALCERSHDIVGEAHAHVELARLDEVSFGVISSAASRLNGLLSGPSGALDVQTKRVLASRLAGLMESRIAEADATDLSRLAWLYLHLKDEEPAKRYTKQGLDRQPENVHIRNLAERLGVS